MNTPVDRVDPTTHARVFAERIVPESNLEKKSSHSRPKAIILAGQPGAGKGNLAKAAERELLDDVLRIDPDALRSYHPDINRFRRETPYTWSSRTQADAGPWADNLLEATVERSMPSHRQLATSR